MVTADRDLLDCWASASALLVLMQVAITALRSWAVLVPVGATLNLQWLGERLLRT